MEIDEMRRQLALYRIPEHDKKKARRYLKDDEKIHSLFFEILRYILYIYLVLVITYGKRDAHIFPLNSNLIQ